MLYLAPGASAAGVHTRHTELVGCTRLQVHLLRQIFVTLAKKESLNKHFLKNSTKIHIIPLLQGLELRLFI